MTYYITQIKERAISTHFLNFPLLLHASMKRHMRKLQWVQNNFPFSFRFLFLFLEWINHAIYIHTSYEHATGNSLKTIKKKVIFIKRERNNTIHSSIAISHISYHNLNKIQCPPPCVIHQRDSIEIDNITKHDYERWVLTFLFIILFF